MFDHQGTNPPEKLYVVVRADLRPGDSLCQAVHAATGWCMRFPGRAARWFDDSNYLVVLAARNQQDLRELELRLELEGLRTVCVHEPDLNDEFTAFAVEHAGGRLLSSLPLALKEEVRI